MGVLREERREAYLGELPPQVVADSTGFLTKLSNISSIERHLLDTATAECLQQLKTPQPLTLIRKKVTIMEIGNWMSKSGVFSQVLMG